MTTMSMLRSALFRLATNTEFERAVRATPWGETTAWRAASRYVAGTREEAWKVARLLHQQGVSASVDQFGEQVGDAETAQRVADDYLRLAAELHSQPEGVWLSLDLSHLGLDVEPERCAERLTAIAGALPTGRRVQVGAEDHSRCQAVLDNVLAAARDPRRVADRLGATIQANLRRSGEDMERLVDAGVQIRLVKGAYVERGDRALPYGEPTDVAYLQLAHRLAEANADFSLATHDGVVREALLAALGPRPVEQLLGVRPDVLDDLRGRKLPVRVYVPYGSAWFRYWMRRVAESRGA